MHFLIKMKKLFFRNRINNINLILATILVGLMLFGGYKLVEDSYTDRREWQSLLSSEANGQHYRLLHFELPNSNEFYPFFNDDLHAEYYNNGIIFNGDFSKSYESDGYFTNHGALQHLPKHIKLEYFCYEDQSFYQLDAPLDYHSLLSKVKAQNLEKPVFIVMIRKDGQIDIDVKDEFLIQEVRDGAQREILLEHSLNAKKVKQDWQILNNIEMPSFSDYLQLFRAQIQWGIKTNLTKDNDVSLEVQNFYNEFLELPPINNGFSIASPNYFPRYFMIYWGNNDNNIYYHINTKNFWKAYQKLNKPKEFYFVFNIDKQQETAEVYIETTNKKLKLSE